MKVSAKLRYARISPQKMRLIADQVRGKPVGVAANILAFMPKKGAKILGKVLESAINNAEHNNGADVDELKISQVMIDEAPRFRRWEARAKGSGNRIIKRNSHITLQVADE